MKLLGKEKKRILILCGNDACGTAAANTYAELLHEHELFFIEERIFSYERIVSFSCKRLKRQGFFSLLNSYLYYILQFFGGVKTPSKKYQPLHTTNNFNSDVLVTQHITRIQPDLVLVAFCGILKKDLLQLLPKHCYNIHPGVTPRYRGFGNLWALYENNVACLGYTIHKIDSGTDTGERITVGSLTAHELSSVSLLDIDVSIAYRAAKHLALLLLGKELPSLPEVFKELPSKLYGVPTATAFFTAQKNLRSVIKIAPRHLLITGASSGIGKELALGYSGQGMHITLWARDTSRLEETAQLCEEKGASVSIISQDMREHTKSREILESLFVDNPVDLAILGAGVSSGTLPDGSPEKIEDACRTMDINGTSTIHMAGVLLALMKVRGSGHVACISSIAAFYPLPDSPAYSAAKVALAYYVKAMRFFSFPVRLSLIYPGYVDSPMSRRLKGPQPMQWTAEKAVQYIKERLDAGATTVIFPLPLALGIFCLNLLPYRLATFFATRFGFYIHPDDEEQKYAGRQDRTKGIKNE